MRKDISEMLRDFHVPSDEELHEIIKNQEKLERICHYTSLDTFIRIIEGVKDDCFVFHAGSIYTMNDRQEMLLGYESIKKYLPEVEKELQVSYDDSMLNFCLDKTQNNEICDKFGEWMTNDDTTSFVVSFSGQSDFLPMWSLYGDIGAGVCLEFAPYRIKEYYKQRPNHTFVSIERCRYNEEEIKLYLKESVKIIYRMFLENVDKDKRKEPLEKAKYLAVMCNLLGTCIKNEGFAYEQEVRMILYRHKDDWRFKPTVDNFLSAYIEAPIPISALTNIIIGPAADMDRVRNGLKLLLRTKGINIEPNQSTIPFRH